MDAFDIAERCDISVKKARKVAKAFSLPTGRRDERSADMRDKLCRNQQLSVKQLLTLLNDWALFRKLGKYENRARAQIFELGNVRADAAPCDVTNHIEAAATGNRESVEIIMRWLKSKIPPWPVRSHWIAVRLLIKRWPNLRNRDYYLVHLALEKVRAHPDFKGWSGKRPVGSQNPMFYHRPQLLFDL